MSRLELDRLLSEDAWIRRLARQLVPDPELADDLVQDAWVAALERPEAVREVRSPRAWLRGVLRNLSLQRSRSEGRRSRREEAAARGEALPSAAELVEEVTLRREVADALLGLDEPYRTALYLRFFKGLSLKKLAREAGVPLSTAHDRVRRGLEILRTRLDRAHGGDRRTWALGLVPLAQAPTGLATTALGGVVMSTAFKVAASLLIVGGVVGVWVQTRATKAALTPDPRVAAPEAPAELAEPIPLLDIEQAPASERAGVPVAASEAPPEEVAAAAASPPVQGRLIDTDGVPLAGVELGFLSHASETPEANARTDGRGRFELALGDPHAGQYVLLDPTLFLIAEASESEDARLFGSSPDEGTTIVLVATPAASYAGRVVDEDGAPVPGAEITLRARTALFHQLGLGWWETFENDGWRHAWDRPDAKAAGLVATSDDEGRFELFDACGGEWTFVTVEAPGFTSSGFDFQTFDLPPHDDLELVFVLERSADVVTVTGTVLDPGGAPAPGAKVSMGQEIVEADENGDFRVTWNRARAQSEVEHRGDMPAWYAPPSTTVVTALKRGYLPVTQELGEEDLEAPLVLRLGPEPLTIAGRVVDGEGEPVEGAVVWLRDPSWFGMWMVQQGESSSHIMTSVEETLRGGFGKRGAVTEADGSFELGGLVDRAYDLQAYDVRTAALGAGWEVDAGARGVELELGTEDGTTRVAGRIVSFSGAPVANVRIAPRRSDTWDTYGSPPHYATSDAEATTDEEGRFEFPTLATEGTHLVLSGERILFEMVALADHEDPEDMTIVQPLLCEMQVDLGARPDLADEVRVLDEDGNALRIAEFRGVFLSHGDSATISEGLSGILRVDERAHTLVLSRGDAEVLRMPLELDPDERRVVRP